MAEWNYIIVGAGIAGITAFKTIRAEKPEASILLISGEDRLPYKRTKLSKFLAKDFDREEFALLSEDDFPEPVKYLRNTWVSQIDHSRKLVITRDKKEFNYENLLLCVGAKPKTLPILINKPGVHFIRELAELEELQDRLAKIQKVVILGNGILGVEAADQVQQLGKTVSILGIKDSPMRKQLNPHLSGDLESKMLEAGIQPFWGETIIDYGDSARFDFSKYADDYIISDDLKTGRFVVVTAQRILPCDLLIVCIGVQGRTKLATSAGIDCDAGILVNEYMETSVPGISAAGDGVVHPGGRITGLWHEAEYQGLIAAKNMMGERKSWQDPEYRAKCEVFGQFYFSAGMKKLSGEDPIWEEAMDGSFYKAYVLKEGKIQALVMQGDKVRAKVYQQAVRENWTPEELDQQLAAFQVS
jgi:NAD(P)H-nitrite reductase large subunit